MRITRVQVQNYKSLYDVELKDIKPLTILVGANDSGKSAILQAINLIPSVVKTGPPEGVEYAEILSHGRNDGVGVHFDLRLDDAEASELLDAIVAPGRTAERDRMRLRLKGWIDEGLFCHTRWELAWRGNGAPVMLQRVQEIGADQALAARNGDRFACVTFERMGRNHETVRDALRDSDTSSLRSPELPRNFLQDTVPGWMIARLAPKIVLTSGTRTALDSGDLVFDEHLRADGRNLLSVLLWMRDHDTDAYGLVCDIMDRLVPSGQIGFRGKEKTASLVFDVADGLFERLGARGAGVEQVLILATRVALTKCCVALLEEPESHIHPGAQRQFMAWLRRLAGEGRQFIVSTHSPAMVAAAGCDAAVRRVVKRDGHTTTYPCDLGGHSTDSGLADLLSDLGARPSDAFLYDSVLLVEGPSDEAVFRAIADSIGSAENRLQLHIAELGGGRGTVLHRFIDERLGAALSADNDCSPNVLVVLDHGMSSKNEIAKLKGLRRVHVLARYELENYLLDPNVVADYIRKRLECEKSKSADITSEDVTEAEVRRLLTDGATRCAPLRAVKQLRDEAKGRLYAQLRALDKAERRVSQEFAKAGYEADPVTLWSDAIATARPPDCVQPATAECSTASGGHTEVSGMRSVESGEAPGSEILDFVFRQFDLRYDKERDAKGLAECMPSEYWTTGDREELAEIIKGLVTPPAAEES